MTHQALMFESLQHKLNATEFNTLFDRYPHLQTLSLDCFDTLIWRKTVTPNDVFFALENRATFKALGLSALLRGQAEAKARQMMLFKQQHSKVKLHDIYRAFNSELTTEQLEALSEEELSTEIELCYAFPPTIDLIRAAHQRGINITLVSDTYFSEPQLRRILTNVLPPDVLPMINNIFCSSEYQRAKTNGLFADVLKVYTGETLLHIGDNLHADYIAPRTLKLNALHFVHGEECVADLLRLQAISACVVDSTIRATRPLYSPFRGILSQTQHLTNQPQNFIGYASLGPLMYVFAHYICAEIEKSQKTSPSLKVIFLMRDAYLPSLACEAFAGKKIGNNVRISRFSAIAASFRTEKDIDKYLFGLGNFDRFHDIARQLLLPSKVSEPLIKVAERHQHPQIEFARLLHRKDILQIIFNRSADYRSRLIHYLEKEIALKSGDTLMLVDLGYSGTVQNQLTPILQDIGINVIGRYLIALRTVDTQNDRRGLIDSSYYDDKTLHMLVNYIVILEQLCTSNEKSVIDYDKAGNVIYSDVSMGCQQHAQLALIQSECVNFIKNAKQFFASFRTTIAWDFLRESAVAELARMIYLPSRYELQYLQSFQFDLNMGTKDVYQIFDPAQGLTGLKRHGLFYMEKSGNTKRTNYPAELRAAGFELAFTSMTQHRLGLDFNLKDLLPRQELLPAILINGHYRDRVTLEAMATHDGYFSVSAPAGSSVTLLLGEKFQWLQIESAELISMHDFIHQIESKQVIDATACLTFNEMDNQGAGLFKCLSETSGIVMKSMSELENKNYVFRFVFRPLSAQEVKPHQKDSDFKVSFNISI